MPALHESVTLCQACDHYVAIAETFPCAECHQAVCPDCAIPTDDPDLSVCSKPCQIKANLRFRREEVKRHFASVQEARALPLAIKGTVQ